MENRANRNKIRNDFRSDIYSKNPNGSFFSPFSLSIDDMEQLILINFEKNPDRYYNVFELQQALDKSGKKKFLVIAYQKDGSTDVYHQRSYPFASQAHILNQTTFIESPLENTIFEVNADNLDVFFDFKDRFGRRVKVKINEKKTYHKKPFFLLAPVGVISKKPGSLPVYSLHDMSFVQKKHSYLEINIGDKKHKADAFPLPIDWSKNYFIRYSSDTFNVDWNKNFHGHLDPLIPDKNNRIEAKGITYELLNNSGHYEIKSMCSKNNKHHLKISLSPPMPDIVCLNPDLALEGSFMITTDKSKGAIGGEYYLKKTENEVALKLHPNKGWKPNESRFILKLLFLIVKVFKVWPKTYEWNAKIKLNETNHPVMESSWKRV